jgi:hypothetical protein
MYFGQLKPALRKLGIRAFRIDEVHHLENIDSRIIKEIEKSDLMVADLTNERPSVYFEAGYGEKKGIPVIYTCRADHLADRGQVNFRVHFDIRQRPIVAWKDPKDRSFSTRLQRRVRALSRGLLSKLDDDLEASKEATDFSRLSPQSRISLMLDATVRLARRAGFSSDKDKSKQYTFSSQYTGYRLEKNSVTSLLIWSAENFLKRELKALRFGLKSADVPSFAIPTEHRTRQRKDRIFVISRHPVRSRAVEGVFPDYEKTMESPGVTAWQTPDMKQVLYVLSGVRSKTELQKRFSAILAQIS